MAALLVPADLRKFLGRWSVQGSEDTYVRTAARICENLQKMAAVHARAQARGGPDYFGEEHLLSQLKVFLECLGVEDAEVSAQIDRLTVANNLLEPTAIATISELGTLAMTQPEVVASAGSDDAVLVQEAPVMAAAEEDEFGLNDDGDYNFEGPPNEDVMQAELVEAQEAEEEPDLLPLAYLCSVSQRGKFRRLHYAGACWRLPGIHFLKWEDLGPDPDLAKVDARCSDCFPAFKPDARQAEAEAASEEDDASSSSSSSSGTSAEDE